MIIISISIFILGLIVGSFLNAVIFRLQSGESFLFKRSHCMSCNTQLAGRDLIPVFSFMYQRGRCRYCKQRISWQYPIVELATAVSFVFLAYSFHFSVFNFQYLAGLVFICFLIIIAVYDFQYYLILDKVVFPALILTLLWNAYNNRIVDGLEGAAIVAGFFGLQYFLSKGHWIGFGDVKLGLFLGSLFGVRMSIVMLLVAYFIGALSGIILILLGKKSLGSKLPFGLFLSLSSIVILFYGQQIGDWYFRFIGF